MGGGGGFGGGDRIPDPEWVVPMLAAQGTAQRLQALEAQVKALQSAAETHERNARWFDKATAYQTAVMAIAYAGYFVLWEKSAGKGVPWLHALAGVLIGVSIAVYICWTLLQSYVIHQQIAGRTPFPNGESLDRAGPAVFAVAALSGVSAAAIVLGMWLSDLVRAICS